MPIKKEVEDLISQRLCYCQEQAAVATSVCLRKNSACWLSLVCSSLEEIWVQVRCLSVQNLQAPCMVSCTRATNFEPNWQTLHLASDLRAHSRPPFSTPKKRVGTYDPVAATSHASPFHSPGFFLVGSKLWTAARHQEVRAAHMDSQVHGSPT